MIKIVGPWIEDGGKYIKNVIPNYYTGIITYNSSKQYVCHLTYPINRIDTIALYLGTTTELEQAKLLIENAFMCRGYKLCSDVDKFNRFKNFQ